MCPQGDRRGSGGCIAQPKSSRIASLPPQGYSWGTPKPSPSTSRPLVAAALGPLVPSSASGPRASPPPLTPRALALEKKKHWVAQRAAYDGAPRGWVPPPHPPRRPPPVSPPPNAVVATQRVGASGLCPDAPGGGARGRVPAGTGSCPRRLRCTFAGAGQDALLGPPVQTTARDGGHRVRKKGVVRCTWRTPSLQVN